MAEKSPDWQAGFTAGFEAAVAKMREQLLGLDPATLGPKPEIPVLLLQQQLKARMPLGTNIEKLELTMRPYNILKRTGLHTLLDVLMYGKDELGEIRNISGTDIDNLVAKFAAIGYTLS